MISFKTNDSSLVFTVILMNPILFSEEEEKDRAQDLMRAEIKTIRCSQNRH